MQKPEQGSLFELCEDALRSTTKAKTYCVIMMVNRCTSSFISVSVNNIKKINGSTVENHLHLRKKCGKKLF